MSVLFTSLTKEDIEICKVMNQREGLWGFFFLRGGGMIGDHTASRKFRQVLDLFKVIGQLEFNRLYFLNKRHVTAFIFL